MDYKNLEFDPVWRACRAYTCLSGAARREGVEVTVGRAVLLLCASVVCEQVRRQSADDQLAHELCRELGQYLEVTQYDPRRPAVTILESLRNSLAHANVITAADQGGQIEILVLQNYGSKDLSHEHEPHWRAELKAGDIKMLVRAFRAYAERNMSG